MKKKASLLPFSFRELMARPDTAELVRLFHLEIPVKSKLKALAVLMEEYEETVLAVQDHVRIVASHIASEGDTSIHNDQADATQSTHAFEIERLVFSLLLVAASARINESMDARQQAGFSSTALKRITFSSVKGIVFNLDGKPQSGMTVVLEAEDPLNTQPLVCMKTNQAGRLPISHELAEGHYMMTMLYVDHVERQPIFIGQPKGDKPEGSVRKLV